jgi:hypothetical protein
VLATVLTPIAASGAVLLMLGAGATHLRRGEPNMLPVNTVLAALALFIRDRALRPALPLGAWSDALDEL